MREHKEKNSNGKFPEVKGPTQELEAHMYILTLIRAAGVVYDFRKFEELYL